MVDDDTYITVPSKMLFMLNTSVEIWINIFFLEILEILNLLSRYFTQFLLMYAKLLSSTAYQYERIVIDG